MTESNSNGAEGDCPPDCENLSFEDALALLDETVRALESGELTLAQSTEMYERGMKLARVCNEALTSAETRVTRIRTAYGERTRMAAQDGGGEAL